MKLPYMTDVPKSTKIVDVFKGYNHQEKIADGEWYDMINMSSDSYPLISTRKERWKEVVPALEDNERILCIFPFDDSYGYIAALEDSHEIRFPVGKAVKRVTLDVKSDRKVITMGGKIVILPDKKYIEISDIMSKTDPGLKDIDSVFRYSGDISLSLCDLDGNKFATSDVPTQEPTNPNPGDMWLDGNTIKRWSSSAQAWEPMTTSYVLFEAPGVNHGFSKGDSIHVSIGSYNLPEDIIQGIGRVDQDNLFGDWYVENTIEDGIVFRGVIGAASIDIETQMTAERVMPDMDFVIESGNRLWGCRYGYAGGKYINEIYASKLGDPTNWRSYQGISTDSYAVSVGADGKFTGAIAYRGVPVFFKEDCLIEIHGSYPSQYRLQSIKCRGVEDGCSKSLTVVDNAIYYKTHGSVCRYDGSVPEDIGENLAKISYRNVVGGCLDNKYYMAGDSPISEESPMIVLDVEKRIWSIESNPVVGSLIVQFCETPNALLILSEDGSCIYSVNRDKTMIELGEEIEPPFPWMLESGWIGLQMPDSKYISRITVRMQISGEVSFYTQYDSSDEWNLVTVIDSTRLRTIELPIRVQRHDHMKLRIEGIGHVAIYSITKVIEKGRDV